LREMEQLCMFCVGIVCSVSQVPLWLHMARILMESLCEISDPSNPICGMLQLCRESYITVLISCWLWNTQEEKAIHAPQHSCRWQLSPVNLFLQILVQSTACVSVRPRYTP
jgi:hypothetical protein